MVKVIDKKVKQIFCSNYRRKVYCFGAGENFKRFLSAYPDMHIYGVIDNYASGEDETIYISGKTFPVISLSQFVSLYDKECIVIITCNFYQDIILQLDEEEILSGMECYPSIFFDSNRNLDKADGLRKWIKTRINQKHDEVILPKKDNGVVNKFQIWNCMPDYRNAGSKAPNDIKEIAISLGYQELKVHMLQGNSDSLTKTWNVKQNHLDWEKSYNLVTDGSILVLQYPTWQIQTAREIVLNRLKKEKNVKIITFLHDVEQLRSVYNDDIKEREFKFFREITDVFIVHNERMRLYLSKTGISMNKMVCLEVFDYLTDAPIMHRDFDKSLIIAGALDSLKSPYISMIKELDRVKFHLFGKDYLEENIYNNILYHGSYPMNQIAEELVGGFGLVWDGDSIDGCSGPTGNYLRYNNPHKLSLYLTAGFPVIVWEEAAVVDIVLKYDVGIVVKSLRHIDEVLNNVSENLYGYYQENVRKLSRKLRAGFFTQKALQNAENILIKEIGI